MYIQKNIRDQLIEVILDGDTVEDLPLVKDLSLDKTIQICQAQDARARLLRNSVLTWPCIHQESVAAVCNQQTQCKSHSSTQHPDTLQHAKVVVAKCTQG